MSLSRLTFPPLPLGSFAESTEKEISHRFIVFPYNRTLIYELWGIMRDNKGEH